MYEGIETLDTVLIKQVFKNVGLLSIRVGDNIISFIEQFNLFMTSNLSNPHYTPEISTKVTIINFTITQSGLEDQLCFQRVTKFRERKESLNCLVIQKQIRIKKIEDQILRVLNKEIYQMMRQLQKYYKLEEKQEKSEYTERKIYEAVIALSQLLNLYQEAFVIAKPNQRIQQRITNINNKILHFIILVKILEQKKQIDQQEFSFIIKQIDVPTNIPENPFKEWLPQQAWARIQVLIKLNKRLSSLIELRLPDPFTQISQIQRMCMLKALRPGKIPKVISDFVQTWREVYLTTSFLNYTFIFREVLLVPHYYLCYQTQIQ